MSKKKREFLTPEQLIAASMLAEGRSQIETAKHIGRTKSAISKWMKDPMFTAKISELSGEIQNAQTSAIREVFYQNEAVFRQQVEEYKINKRDAYKAILKQGLQLLHKVQEKTKDLTPNDIKIGNIAPLLTAGTNMVSDGFKQWDEFLEINYYRRSAFKELDAVMLMVEANVYPLEIQVKINDAFSRCQDEVIEILRESHSAIVPEVVSSDRI